MEIFKYEKSLYTRLEECSEVLVWTDHPVTTSRVQSEWSSFIEIQIEPSGWDAIWKIPRQMCEEFNIKYPTVVFGSVQNVLFDELKATFNVTGVTDDDIHVPEQMDVLLEDLYPTIEQENDAINIEKTADCIDSLRFFYKHIWMPWDADNDDDFNWADKYLESRIKFCYDLRKETNQLLVSHVRSLLIEARYIAQRRECLELDIDDIDHDNLDETTASSTPQVTELFRLHHRLDSIKNEIELYENPVMRACYSQMKFTNDPEAADLGCDTFVVSKIANVSEQIDFLNAVNGAVGKEKNTQICSSLQECLDKIKQNMEIYLPASRHTIKPYELLGRKCLALKAISNNASNEVVCTLTSTVQNSDNSILLTIDGDLVLENVTIDCRNVQTGIVLREGSLLLRNCTILGNELSSTKIGIIVSERTTLRLDGCTIKDFCAGIKCFAAATVQITNSIISNCMTGLECKDDCKISLKQSNILNSKQYGIVYSTRDIADEKKKIAFENLSKLNCKSPFSDVDCKFSGNKLANICVYNLNSNSLYQSLDAHEHDVFEDADDDRLQMTSEQFLENGPDDSAIGCNIADESSANSSSNYADCSVIIVD